MTFSPRLCSLNARVPRFHGLGESLPILRKSSFRVHSWVPVLLDTGSQGASRLVELVSGTPAVST